MGYSLLTESDSAVESAETSPSRRLPRYNHILIIALASIAINILLLLRILLPSPTLFPAARDTNGFSTDTPFGDLPFDTYMVMNNDTSFTVLDQNFESQTTFDLSDEQTRKSLYFETTWLALEHSKIGNTRSKGLSVKDTAANPSAWVPDTRVFALSAFHHVHCIELITDGVHDAENGDISGIKLEHMHHCLAILRHAVMCAGDMTLEELDKHDTTSPWMPQWGNSGFHNMHVCRNWTKILERTREFGIVKSKHGWVPL